MDRRLPDVAQSLGYRQSGNRVRINVQLIETATDHHLWVKTYDRDTRDILVCCPAYRLLTRVARKR
jgi:diaminopimelate epimerase